MTGNRIPVPRDIRAAVLRFVPPAFVAAAGRVPRLALIQEHVIGHLHQPLDRDAISRLVGLSPCSFSRYFHRTGGCTYMEWLNRVRVGYATWLLEHRHLPLARVATLSGFGDQRALRRGIVRVHEICPRGYLRRLECAREGARPSGVTEWSISATNWPIPATIWSIAAPVDGYKPLTGLHLPDAIAPSGDLD
jgi:AraC-like DNA-binding protein